jgi:hypothetical protein
VDRPRQDKTPRLGFLATGGLKRHRTIRASYHGSLIATHGIES